MKDVYDRHGRPIENEGFWDKTWVCEECGERVKGDLPVSSDNRPYCPGCGRDPWWEPPVPSDGQGAGERE